MKLKDFFAFKDWLSYRQKVGLLVIAGVSYAASADCLCICLGRILIL